MVTLAHYEDGLKVQVPWLSYEIQFWFTQKDKRALGFLREWALKSSVSGFQIVR